MSTFNSDLWGGTLPGGLASGSVGTVTARSLIVRVYQMLTVIRAGQTPSAAQLSEGLDELNQMLDSWALERLTVPSMTRDSVDLVADTIEYEVLTPRELVDAASLQRGDSLTESPLQVLSEDPRAVHGARGVYFDGAGTMVLSFLPTEGDHVILSRWVPLGAFADLDSLYALPTGYTLAIRFALADQISPAVMTHVKSGNVDLAKIARKAIEYKRTIKSRHAKPLKPQIDSALIGGRLSGFWGRGR